MLTRRAWSVAAVVPRLRRGLSTPAKVPRTPEQRKSAVARTKVVQRMNFPSTKPQSLTVALGSAKELHIPNDIAEVASLSGMPYEHAKRTVQIAPRMLKTVQSGQMRANQWQLKWPMMERWTNPLMGWTSTADPMSNVKLSFDSKEDAIAFATRNGWKFELYGDTTKKVMPGGAYRYKHNFLNRKTEAIIKRDGHKTTLFESPGFGKSNFFMPLKYHGDGVVTQHGPSPTK